MKTYAIILASGVGSRFGENHPKQFVEIHGKMILGYTVDVFLSTSGIDEIIIVVSKPYLANIRAYVEGIGSRGRIRVIEGGRSRQESCVKGVAAIVEEEGKVLIHNAVQPFVTPATLADCIRALDSYDAVSVGSPSVYTVLELDDNRILKRIVRRDRSVNDLGPECFKLSVLRRAFAAETKDVGFTNLTALVMQNRIADVYVVDGDPSNIKITYPDDLYVAERILAARNGASVKACTS